MGKSLIKQETERSNVDLGLNGVESLSTQRFRCE